MPGTHTSRQWTITAVSPTYSSWPRTQLLYGEWLRRQGERRSARTEQYRFPGLKPGDRWCVTAANWLRAHYDGAAAPVVLASTHERALDIVPLAVLEDHAVDVPADPGALED